MSPISLALEIFLAALLIAALVFGWRLERKLKALRDGQSAFAASVRDLDEAARRADSGLKTLRDALDETQDGLHDRIQKGRALKSELETLIRRAEALPRAPAPQAATLAAEAARSRAPDRVSDMLDPGFGDRLVLRAPEPQPRFVSDYEHAVADAVAATGVMRLPRFKTRADS